tara:strand:+ start:3286 stop:3537 length:252 start_codon:yes stop_codon:yes gene_type:complete
LFFLKFKNLKIYFFLCLIVQFFGLPRNSIAEIKPSKENIALNAYIPNEKLLNVQDQKFSTELFHFNDELHILDKRIKALLGQN